MSASGPGHDGLDEQESLEELFGTVFGLAGEIASRISQDQVEARLRRTLQAAGRRQEEEPARKATRRDPESAGPVTGPPPAGLVSQAAAGDRDAWDEIVERYAPLIWSICRGHCLGSADAAGNDLPFDGLSQGEVLLRGPWIIESYAKLADDTGRFLDGYWRSGDVGVIDKHGYLKITDRLKDVIKSGGEWISSIDMENAITSHPRIREAAVIGVEHPTWQERPVIIAVTDDGTEIPLAEIHALLPAFARWQLPDTVVYVDAIPRTSVGKIDKKALRAAHAGTYRTTA